VHQTIISLIQKARCYSIKSNTTPGSKHMEYMSQIGRFVEIKRASVGIKSIYWVHFTWWEKCRGNHNEKKRHWNKMNWILKTAGVSPMTMKQQWLVLFLVL